MDALAHVVVWLNAVANAVGGLVLAPIAVLPGWLSATIVSVATGLLLLVIFKYTSHQRAIKRVRDDIKANLLSLKLFKDSTSVTFLAQGRVFVGAFRLMVLAIVPMAVMLVPVCLFLGQLAPWYQNRPLQVGEEAVMTLKLNGDVEGPQPDVRLEPTTAVDVTIGPVRVLSKREVCWNIRARENGYHRVRFRAGGQAADKQLAVGDGWMRLSARRPAWRWSDILLYPCERPFGPGSLIQSIQIDYPGRESWTSGTDWWIVYWFAVSLVAALCFRRLLNVNI